MPTEALLTERAPFRVPPAKGGPRCLTGQAGVIHVQQGGFQAPKPVRGGDSFGDMAAPHLGLGSCRDFAAFVTCPFPPFLGSGGSYTPLGLWALSPGWPTPPVPQRGSTWEAGARGGLLSGTCFWLCHRVFSKWKFLLAPRLLFLSLSETDLLGWGFPSSPPHIESISALVCSPLPTCGGHNDMGQWESPLGGSERSQGP